MTDAAPTYRAFISYSHADKRVAAWLQSALERYHVPARLVGRATPIGPAPARLHPLFRDRDELPASADLGGELLAALRRSLFLIVICSPAAARSRWVNEEILNFKSMHGEGRVLALICDGEPGDPEHECFPEALRYRIGEDGGLTTTPAEPIASDIRPNGDGRRLARFKLIAALTGLRLDDLLQREAARRVRRLTAIAVAAVIGMLFTSALAFYANTQRIEAVAQRRIAETESAASRAASDYLVDTFALADPETENPRTITALTILGRSADRARDELSNQPAIQLRLIDTIARAYLNLGLYDDARDAIEKSRPTIDALGADGVQPLLTLARVYFREGKLDEAISTARGAEARIDGKADDDQRAIEARARAQEVIAQALYDKNELEPALKAYDSALSLYRQAPSARPEALPGVLTNRGLLLTGMGRYDAARASLVEANRRYAALDGPQSFMVGKSLYALADNRYLAGDVAGGLGYIDRALAIYRKVLDPGNPTLAYALSMRGQMLRDLKRPGEAAGELARAVAIFREQFGKPHYMIGITEVYQALAVADTGKTDAALAILDDAKHNYDVGYGHIHANHGDLLVNRASILARAGRIAQARESCAEGMKILNETMDKSDPLLTTLGQTCARIDAA